MPDRLTWAEIRRLALRQGACALVRALFVAQHQIIVAARHIQADEHHAAVTEADILGKFAAQWPLTGQCQPGLAKTVRLVGQHLTQLRQALQRVITAVVQAMAIGPFVVTHRVDQWFFQAVEHGCGAGKGGIIT